MAAPQPPAEEIPRETADVETSSEEYARRFAGSVGRYFLKTQTDVTLRLLAPWPRARVLDVGGGHAQLAPSLVARGHAVTVVGSHEICRERLDREMAPGTFEFHACDLLDLPFPDRSFDVVLAFRLLAHVPRWRELIAELARVAERAVIVDFSDSRSFNALYGPLFQWKKKIEGNTRTFITFRPGEVRTELARHGFGRPVEVRQFFAPMVVHRALGKALRTAAPSRVLEAVSSGLGLTRALGSPVILRAQREESTSS
ncbi:MAG TPA: class I SAM-dependent methyltransferase [Thermoanaerobaculia bacterium]|nr:class I SAM-dependent methyltransferase [Thermoanaerobaculia bacterium]